jgi:lipopolysaccharide export system protein LptA
MNTRLLPALLLTLCLPLAACGDSSNSSNSGKPASSTGTPVVDADSIGGKVKAATDKARVELAQGNIKISNDRSDKAEITPQGDLLINGKAVTVDAKQRALLLDYRKSVEALAGAGMDIGVAGASLGVKAAGEALRGVFSGNTEGIEEKVNAEAAKMEASAQQLCGLLPTMLAKQQALAVALPAFKPYATMDQGDIDDCHS